MHLCLGNGTIRNPEDVIYAKKICDMCDLNLMKSLYYTCVSCAIDESPFYDFCNACFHKRAEIGHIHDNFIKVPATSYPLSTFGEHLDRLRLAMESEIPIGALMNRLILLDLNELTLTLIGSLRILGSGPRVPSPANVGRE